MYLLRRKQVWLQRFRYRRGYGIHSPFAFNFVTGVVYEKGIYYAYQDLDRNYGLHRKRLGFSFEKKQLRKCARLLFRISNYVHPDFILVYGNTKNWVDGYLAAGCVSAGLMKFLSPESEMHTRFADKTLLVYLDDIGVAEQVWASLSGFSTLRSVFLISGIHADVESVGLWHRFQAHPAVGITFDLYDYGIVFWDRTRFKQHYLVNF